MNKLSNKCGSCGYTLTFDTQSQSLKCLHCESITPINAQNLITKHDYTVDSSLKQNDEHNLVYSCVNCGAKTNISEHILGKCPYCGSSDVEELSNSLKHDADGIIPFEISKDVAQKKYKEWLKRKKFVPNNLKNKSKIKTMEGFYCPCFCFDYDVQSKYSGVGIREHRVTRHVRTSNGTMRTVTDVEITRHPFSGSRNDKFENLIITANGLVADYEIEKLGNFGLEKLKVFNPAYLLGFVSQDGSQTVHQGFSTSTNYTKKEIEERIKNAHGFDRLDSIKLASDYQNKKYNYIYLPIYICSFIYKQKDYRFLVNGYSGYVTGKVPRSGWKIFGFVMLIILAVLGVVFLANL